MGDTLSDVGVYDVRKAARECMGDRAEKMHVRRPQRWQGVGLMAIVAA